MAGSVHRVHPGRAREPKAQPTNTGQGKLKTASKDKWGQDICKGYNDKRGCPDSWTCRKANVCDVMMANGKACGSYNHNRTSHTGPKLFL